MFNPTNLMAENFGDHVADTYSRHFEGRNSELASYLRGAACLILERIGNSDALYHNAEHTMMGCTMSLPCYCTMSVMSAGLCRAMATGRW